MKTSKNEAFITLTNILSSHLSRRKKMKTGDDSAAVTCVNVEPEAACP